MESYLPTLLLDKLYQLQPASFRLLAVSRLCAEWSNKDVGPCDYTVSSGAVFLHESCVDDADEPTGTHLLSERMY